MSQSQRHARVVQVTEDSEAKSLVGKEGKLDPEAVDHAAVGDDLLAAIVVYEPGHRVAELNGIRIKLLYRPAHRNQVLCRVRLDEVLDGDEALTVRANAPGEMELEPRGDVGGCRVYRAGGVRFANLVLRHRLHLASLAEPVS